jgi:tetratricopeptide (TPR) repeat protein
VKRCWLIVLCALLFIASAPRAYAAPTNAAIAEAQQHFMQGTKSYNLGEYARAAEEYKAAYDAMPDPALLYNIAQSYRLGNNPARALFFYRAYLRTQPNASNRREIEDRIRDLSAEIEPQLPPPHFTKTAPPAIAPIVDATLTTPAPRPHKPLYKKGWFWGTVVGIAVAAGVGVGLGVGLTRSNVPHSGLGNQVVFSAGVAR